LPPKTLHDRPKNRIVYRRTPDTTDFGEDLPGNKSGGTSGYAETPPQQIY
jgi:hypothetical protein